MLVYGIAIFKIAVSTMLENGLLKQRNIGDGADCLRVGAIRKSCFAMGTRGWAKRLFGNRDSSPERGGNDLLLTSHVDSSLVVERLCKQVIGQNIPVLGFYFDFAARGEQSARSMLGSLLKQIVSGMEIIPGEVYRVFQEHKKTKCGRGPELAVIVKMLQAITSLQPTFMCIDAMDECEEEQRAKLLDSLEEILEKCPGTRILVTGRPHIRDEIEERLTVRVISVSISPRKDDMIKFLHVRLSKDRRPKVMSEGLKTDILREIPEKMSEMFLLVSLCIDSILQESTIRRRRERLRKMLDGPGLGGAYGATIERINEQDGDRSAFGMMALMWISHAERPLTAAELCHALAVELGSTEFEADNVPLMSILVDCCQGLITVDKKASTVRLIHITLKQYLSVHPDTFDRPHAAMAEICLTYLNSGDVKAISADPSPDILSTPFLEYCSAYWGAHAKKDLSQRARSLALNLLQQYDGHISSKLLLRQARHLYVKDFGISFSFNGLHCASFFGIVEVADTLIVRRTYDINGRDFSGYTPLAWAARNGHDEMVKMLLGQKMLDPDKPDNSGQTPLSRAAGKGHERVVQILLEQRGVNPDRPNNYGLTPLSCAARNGHEGVVKILLGRKEVSPARPNCVGITPLMFAARYGHERAAALLEPHELVTYNTV